MVLLNIIEWIFFYDSMLLLSNFTSKNYMVGLAHLKNLILLIMVLLLLTLKNVGAFGDSEVVVERGTG